MEMNKLTEQNAEEILIGKVGRPYGIKGWIKIISYTNDIEDIFKYSPWLVRQSNHTVEYSVQEWKKHNKGLVCRLKDVTEREIAEKLTNSKIFIKALQLDDLQDNEYYWRDLIGCQVFNLDNYNMGTVTSLIETGSSDVLEIQANANDAFQISQRLIPMVMETFIIKIDKQEKTIIVDWSPNF